MNTPGEIIKGQAIRYVDTYQVGDGANTLAKGILAALHDAGYAVKLVEPACILCWCRRRETVEATMFDGIAWYCEEHGDEVVTDRLRPRWVRRLRHLAGLS